MKTRFLIFIITVYSCNTHTKSNNSEKSSNEKIIETINEPVKKTYFVGDLDNDHTNDTATVTRKRNTAAKTTEYRNNYGELTIEFGEKIPQICIPHSLGIIVFKYKDLNNDKANEVIVFSRTYEGWWNKISVWSFNNQTWKNIAQTNAFIIDEIILDHFIINENGTYYLIGDNKWEEDDQGNFKKVKIRI